MEISIYITLGIFIGVILSWWHLRSLMLKAVASFQGEVRLKQSECDYLAREYLIELARGMAAEYITRDERLFTGLMLYFKREYPKAITDSERQTQIKNLASEFEDIKDFSLSDTLACVASSFRYEDFSTTELSTRLKKIMRYLSLRFEHPVEESAEFWLSEQRGIHEARKLADEVAAVERAYKAHVTYHSKCNDPNTQVGEYKISMSYVPFGFEYTFMPMSARENFDRDDWYILGWEECTPEDVTYVEYFKRPMGDRANTITLHSYRVE
jgi:hypothetical protein